MLALESAEINQDLSTVRLDVSSSPVNAKYTAVTCLRLRIAMEIDVAGAIPKALD